VSKVSMPEEPPRRPPRRGASILSDTDGDGSDDDDDDDDDRRFAGGADADSPSVPAQPDSDEDDRDEEALDAQIEALRRQIAAGRLTPSAAHPEMDQVAEDPVDELLGSERWDAGALAAADNDTLDALIDRLAKSRPQTDPMSMLEREEAAARRMKVQTDLMAYLHELRRRAKVDFPPDFAELVEELVANATKRDAQLRAVGLRGKVAAIDDDDRYDRYDDAGSGGGGRMPDPWTNPEPGLDMISAEDLDPKIHAGLEKIRRYDEMLLAKEAEQRMVEQETLERAGGGGGGDDGSSSVTVRVGAGDDGDDGDELAGGLEARVARRRARRLRKIARLRRTLRGDDAERMGGAAARNAANTRGAQRLAKLTEEEDALAERLLEEFAREEEGPRSGTRGIDSSTAAPVDVDADADMDADMDDDMDADMDADVDADARSVAASTRSFVSSATANPFAVHRAIAGVVHPGAGTAFGSLDVDAHGHVLDEDARRLAEIERALGEIASGRGTAAETQPAETQPAALERPATAVSSSPAPSSASALARRLGAPSVSAGGWDDDGEKENDSVRTRGEFDAENYLEDAREDRELREVDETVDAALRRMKTKGAFPERLTAEEMRRLVDECRSEQGA